MDRNVPILSISKISGHATESFDKINDTNITRKKNHYNRPKSAYASTISEKTNDNELFNTNNKLTRLTRPSTATVCSSSSLYSVPVNNIVLKLNLPKQPSLLERYWKYNKIKKSEILTNRYIDTDASNRLYLLCTESYWQNMPKLVRQRPKSGNNNNNDNNKSKSISINNNDNNDEIHEKFNKNNRNNINVNNINIEFTSNTNNENSIKKNNNRRCFSATPRLARANMHHNINTIDHNNNNNNYNNFNYVSTKIFNLKRENTDKEHKHQQQQQQHQQQHQQQQQQQQQQQHQQQQQNNSNTDINSTASTTTTTTTLNNNINNHNNNNNKIKQETNIEIINEYEDINNVDDDDIKTTITATTIEPITNKKFNSTTAKTHRVRPISSVSKCSNKTTITEYVAKKNYSVSEFNKFKTKLIDRKHYQRPFDNLDHLYNAWLNKPLQNNNNNNNNNSSKYSTEMKRLNYATFIKKRQLFLSESLYIKKLN